MEVVSISNLVSWETEKTTTASAIFNMTMYERPNRKLCIYVNMKLFMKVISWWKIREKAPQETHMHSTANQNQPVIG